MPLSKCCVLIVSAFLVSCAAADPAAWTPEQGDLLFSSNRSGNGEIYILRAGSQEWANLTDNPASDNWAEWSPDGKRILFQSQRNGNLDLFAVNADGSDLVQLTDNAAHDYVASWSPVGDEIYFASWRREPGESEDAVHFYVMNPDGSNQRRLMDESPMISGALAVSADGKHFAFVKKTGDEASNIVLVNRESGEARQVTHSAVSVGSPDFSPDGSMIAYYEDDGEVSKIVVNNLDGSDPRVVVASGKNWYPRWSPDGRWLVMTTSASEDGSKLALTYVSIETPGAPATLIEGDARHSEGRWRH
jgi:TolB protein